ncbi:MAG: purN [Bacteroidota bacterium]|nr:purN [Bacteroidota bacterium]
MKETRIRRLFLFLPRMKQIAIFASGKGTNAESIIEYFRDHASIKVALIVTNNPAAGVIKIAHSNKIISAIVSKEALNDAEVTGRVLNALNIDMIVLAGFLQLIPQFLLQKYPGKIVNIHPALLPKFGGKGMYGLKVHEAVLTAKEKETGITVHYVNEHYDEGEVILQKTVSIKPSDNPESLSAKVLSLEHEWYPKTIEKLLI